MSWRIVSINSRCKLDLKMGCMVVRGDETKRVFLDEIAILIIENPSVSLTCCLLEALIEKKVKIIFCDEKRSPMGELMPYYGSCDCSRKLRMQMEWNDDIKGVVWSEIIAEKIRHQSDFLLELEKARESQLLLSYLGQIEEYDATNREGHAAKVYFNGIFGMEFTRSADNVINAALNYGYSLILSTFNREIVSCGYLTQLGLFHSNTFNPYNLSCDLMEPFRVLIDREVYKRKFTSFSTDEKHIMMNILNNSIRIAESTQTILNAIKIYCYSVFDALNEGEISRIKFYRLK